MQRLLSATAWLVLACSVTPPAGVRAVKPPPPLQGSVAAAENSEPPPTVEPPAPVGQVDAPVALPPLFVPDESQLRGQGPTHRLSEMSAAPLKRRWRAKVGKTTFRTTIGFAPSAIVLGTHGATLEGKNERSDGVYVLDALSGKQRGFVPTPGQGDRDVGGVALDGDWVIFSTDNGLVVKASWSTGKLAWTTALAGKVRPAPALADLDGGGALDVVVGDEAGDLHALDGETGAHLWLRSTGANEYDARGFVAAAAIGDLNGDEIDDVVAGARDGVLVAYDGRSGVELWREDDGSGIHASPTLLDIDGDGRAEVLAAWSYGRVALLDAPTGTVRYAQRLEQDEGGIEGLFATPVPMPLYGMPGLIVQGTAWWGGRRGRNRPGETIDGVVLVSQVGRVARTDEGRVTASAVIMDLGDDQVWDAVVGTEAGELLALNGRARRVLSKLAGPIEATAAARDLDGDGRVELLVASNDGFLSCLETDSTRAPLVTRFRGATSDNRGNLGSIDLGFVPPEQ